MTVRYLVDTDGTIHDVNGHPGIVARLDALKEQGLALSVVSLADFDLLVGATALQHDLTLLRSSRRHFEFVEGLRLESQPQSAQTPLVMMCIGGIAGGVNEVLQKTCGGSGTAASRLVAVEVLLDVAGDVPASPAMLGQLAHDLEQGPRRRARLGLGDRQGSAELGHDLVPHRDPHDRARVLLESAHELRQPPPRLSD
jgi:hypothetical protein